MNRKMIQVIELATADRINRDMAGSLMSYFVCLALTNMSKKILKGE